MMDFVKNLFLNEEEMEEIYNELCEEMNIENIMDLDYFKIKLKEIIKQEKENYKGWNKEKLMSELKEKSMDFIF